jgi:hypothetical protein
MSRRVLLGKAGSDYGLFISKIGVDVVDDSGNLCNNDLMIFDSREKGYAQVIKKGTVNVSRGVTNAAIPFTSTGIAIPNPVVILYANGSYVELAVSDFAFTLFVPLTYPSMSSYGYSLYGTSTTGANTPATTTVNYIVLRGYA